MRVRMWVAAIAAGLTLTAQGAYLPLVDLGDGTVYDPNQQLIWLKDWDVNGEHDWFTQSDWAQDLVFAGSSDWRLPEIGEYRTLHDEFGSLIALGAFNNPRFGLYWSGTATWPGHGWVIDIGGGYPLSSPNPSYKLFAVAVRSGDVASPLPEPGTHMLVLLALVAGYGASIRKPT